MYSDKIRFNLSLKGKGQIAIETLTGRELIVELAPTGVRVPVINPNFIFTWEAIDEICNYALTLPERKMYFGNEVMRGHRNHEGEIGYGLRGDSINGYYGEHILHTPVGQVPLRVANHFAPILAMSGLVTMHRGVYGDGLGAYIVVIRP